MFLPPLAEGEEWIGIVIALPEPWVSQLTELRIALGDKQGERVPAHITLLPPTPVRLENREKLITYLREIAERHRPFRVHLKTAKTFLPSAPVAYLDLAQGGRECAMLADDIRTDMLNVQLRFPYHPHVTLAQGVDEATLNEALAITKNFEASWLVPGFRLDRVDEDGYYSSRAIFHFGGH